MPEVPHHAHEMTINTPGEWTATFTREVVAFLETWCAFFALKHEIGENGKLHVHLGIILEMCTSRTNGGAKTASNLKTFMLKRCPTLSAHIVDKGTKYSFVTAPMKSDIWIAEYLQKDGELQYKLLPDDLNELRPYFADMLAKKLQNPDYDKWASMYIQEEYPLPASGEFVWKFFHAHMHLENDVKIVADKKKLRDRCDAVVAHINKDVTVNDNPYLSLKRGRTEKYDEVRICPRCAENRPDKDPMILEFRAQYCELCRKY